ncbi:hypothetical protein A2U01_0003638 [Trifolium medium]|uniref:Uncharacterized protein n=1 Tax=Trifolium medium TaxID=97028 RepID=A0A392M640_9FABA|nr:hypothetical protein [Trifolium medium]
MFIDSVRGFKERYYVVKLMTPLAIDSLYKTEVVTEDNGATRLDANGAPVTRRVTWFLLKWSGEHFGVSTDSYLTKDDALTEDELAGLEKLRAFVDKFQPTRYMTKTGIVRGNRGSRLDILTRRGCSNARAKRIARLCSVFDLSYNTVLGQSGPVGFSSPGGASSSLGAANTGSPVVRQPPPKRQREEVPVINLDLERPFLLPRCFSAQGFLEKHPLMVAEVERSDIMGLEPAARQEQLVQDTAAMMRLLETALVLNDEKDSSTRDLEKLKGRNEKLEAEAEKDLRDLRASHTEEKKNLVEELGKLKSAMAPAEGEPATVEGLTTRGELVGVIKSLGEKVVSGVTYGFNNAVAQLKIVNSGLELSTEGIGVLKRVENGEIVIPEKYR